MANQSKRLDSNVPGNFYVDATCINCDTCRQLAPETFEEAGEYSAVAQQPRTDEQVLQAYQALLACPVGSIGAEHIDKRVVQQAKVGFPLQLDEEVSYCGFNSEKSFGANSFFVRHPGGNWLVDSPRYVKHLVEAFGHMGGIAFIFLTHEDDVADADLYARHFGAIRIIHRADAAAVPGAEWILEGEDSLELRPQFTAIPVPGHTAGSQALLYRDRFLFTGDHLWWEPGAQRLGSPSRLVSDHEQQLQSIKKLLAYRFQWVLAGHGDRVCLSDEDMRAQLRSLIERRRPAAIC
ncbi:MAG: MBL fold metallo-hydrolase [Nitrospiraceae bacterium]|nr:MBL fold metallo-hydrolase [Nitrospiraceae bacterium]